MMYLTMFALNNGIYVAGAIYTMKDPKICVTRSAAAGLWHLDLLSELHSEPWAE